MLKDSPESAVTMEQVNEIRVCVKEFAMEGLASFVERSFSIDLKV